MDDRDVFLKAIDVLQERGWHQGGIEGSDGSVCVVGAICAVIGVTYWCGQKGLMNRLSMALGTGSYGGWNDAPERTYEDVVLALKRAAHGEAA